jgi:hypothetical protein
MTFAKTLALCAAGLLLACGARSNLDAENDASVHGFAHDATVVAPEASAPTDAGPPDVGYVLPAGVDASALLPCLEGTGNLFSIEAHDYLLPFVPDRVTDADGAWTARYFGGSLLTLSVGSGSRLGLTASVSTEPLASGKTYESVPRPKDGRPSYLQLVVNGVSCDTIPTGRFTVARLEATEAEGVSDLLMFFELKCVPQGAAEATGCLRYQR